MERRGSNTWLIAALAIAVGFLAAILIFGTGKSHKNSSATVAATTTTATSATQTQGQTTPQTTTTTATVTQSAAPTNPQPTVAGCIALWNQQNNRENQTYVVNIATRQPIRVHVGATADVPPKCLITVVANNGDAYVFPEAGGTTFPYAQAPAATQSSSLPPAQKVSNALNQSDGTLKAP